MHSIKGKVTQENWNNSEWEEMGVAAQAAGRGC